MATDHSAEDASGFQGARLMQIGEVADLLGLSLRSIRYYGEMELAPPSARSDGGFRLYGPRDVARLRLIMEMKPLGFSLEQMRDLLEAKEQLAALDDADHPAQLDEGIIERLATLHDAAQDRVAQLTEQLAMAKVFARDRAVDLKLAQARQ